MKKFISVISVAVLFAVLLSGVASAEQCVQYVKRMKPEYKRAFPVKVSPTKVKTITWNPANDLWLRLWVKDRGATPKKNSVFVMEKNGSKSYFYDYIAGKNVTMDVGHTGIVTDVQDSGKKIKVNHANWDVSGGVSTGYYTRSNTSTTTWYYTTSRGTKWRSPYKILGFVYKPF